MKQINFIVEGMTCGHCKAAVEKILSQISGVTDVKVDLASKEVNVVYDTGQTSMKAFKTAIKDAGFEVKEI